MSDNRPLVTIAIPTFNRAKYLREAIISVLNQSYKNIDIIISDNCSTDNTGQVVQEFTDPRLRYFKQLENLGMVGNWNSCLNQANGEYFLLLSDDDVLEVNAVEQLLSAFDRPDVVISYCRFLYVDDEMSPVELSIIAPNIESGHEFITNSLKNLRWVVPSVMLHKTDAAIKFGGYPDIGTTSDLAVRLMLAKDGFVSFNPNPFVKYRRHSKSLSQELKKVVDSHERLILWAKNGKCSLHDYDDIIIKYCIGMVYKIARYAILFDQSNSILIAQEFLRKYSYSIRQKIMLRVYSIGILRSAVKPLWVIKGKYRQLRTK